MCDELFTLRAAHFVDTQGAASTEAPGTDSAPDDEAEIKSPDEPSGDKAEPDATPESERRAGKTVAKKSSSGADGADDADEDGKAKKSDDTDEGRDSGSDDDADDDADGKSAAGKGGDTGKDDDAEAEVPPGLFERLAAQPAAQVLVRHARRQGREAVAMLGELRTTYRYTTLLEVIRNPRTGPQRAGVLLLVVFGLGLITGLAYNLGWAGYEDPWEKDGVSNIQGSVYDSGGTPIEGASVVTGGETSITNAQGKYYFYNLSAGDVQLMISRDGYRTESLWLSIEPRINYINDFELLEGSGVHAVDERDDTTQPWPPTQLLAPLFVVAGFAALLGGAAALLHRHYRMALVGAVVGVLSYGFLLGSVLSLMALVMLLRGRHHFGGDPLLEDNADES